MRPYPTPEPSDPQQPLELRYASESLAFRGEDYAVQQAFWYDPVSESEFTTAPLDDLTLAQVHGAYRERHGIPFPEEIKRIREQYGMSARGMSDILGFGVNQYRLYEGGEVPTVPHGKLIRSVDNPAVFAQHLATAVGLPKSKHAGAHERIVALAAKPPGGFTDLGIASYASVATGYTMPSLEKVAGVVALLSEGMTSLFSTKLNKLLYYTDTLSFRYFGQAITGLQYRAIQNGPVPSQYHELFGVISNEEVAGITVRRPERTLRDVESGEEYQVESYSADAASHSAAKALFTSEQLSVIALVRERLGFRRTRDLVAYVHEETSWMRHEGGREVIPYGEAFEVREL